MEEDVFEYKNDGLQEIEVTNREIIKNLLDNYMEYWKEEIYNFKEWSLDLKLEFIYKLELWLEISEKDVSCVVILIDGKRKRIYINSYHDFILWLEKNGLIK